MHVRASLSILMLLSFVLIGCMDSVSDTVSPEQELFDDTVFIDEDSHLKLTWSIDSVATIRIAFEKNEGPNVDLYTMTELNYEDYKKCAEGEESTFYYIEELSDPDTAAANLEADIDAGTYVTVIDNTDCGQAKPPDQSGLFSSDENDRAGVDYRITAQ